MTNTTEELHIVRRSDGFATVANHALVLVNEQSDGLSRHLRTILPGQTFKPPFLGRGAIVAYQVNLADRLRFRFSSKLLHRDGVHGFTLEYDLSFRVLKDKPEIVVLQCAADPVAAVAEEAKRVFSGPIQSLPWHTLESCSDVTPFATNAASEDDNGELVNNLERVKIYARYYGIEVRVVQVTRHLEGVDLKVAQGINELARTKELTEQTIEKLRREKQIEKARIEIATDLAVAREWGNAEKNAAHAVATCAEGVGTAVETVVKNAGSIREIEDILVRGMRMVDNVRQHVSSSASQPNGNGIGEFAAPAVSLLADGTFGSSTTSKVPAAVATACDVAAELVCDGDTERNRFLAAMLHVIADKLDPTSAERHAGFSRYLDDLYRQHAQDMAEGHARFVAGLVNGNSAMTRAH